MGTEGGSPDRSFMGQAGNFPTGDDLPYTGGVIFAGCRDVSAIRAEDSGCYAALMS